MFPSPFVPQRCLRVHMFHKCVSPVTVFKVPLSTWSVSQYICFSLPIVPVPMFLGSAFPSLCSPMIFTSPYAPQSLYSTRPFIPLKCFQSLCSPKIFPSPDVPQFLYSQSKCSPVPMFPLFPVHVLLESTKKRTWGHRNSMTSFGNKGTRIHVWGT